MTTGPDPHHDPDAPSPWVVRFAPLVPAGGRCGDGVLDVACGSGRNARLFLGLGRPVVAIDRDVSGVADLRAEPRAEVIEADLERGGPWPLAGRRFAAVVVTNYLYRPLFADLIGAVGPGGLFIYETFARGNERFGRPRNPDHLLRSGELLEAVRGHLQVIAYEHGIIAAPRQAVVQRLCAAADLPQRGGPGGNDAGEPPPHPLTPANARP